MLIRSAEKIRELYGQPVEPFRRVNFLQNWVWFLEFLVGLLPPKYKHVTVQFFVVLKYYLVQLYSLIFLPYMLDLQLVRK